ncbi:MAG TPA: hypothetical protein VKQ08_01945 [Cyclobacteriaceae bacterium]|nr:hypothetical protein [Cyclobacteriaceae bacterium]
METNQALTGGQLDKLKADVRQRFDELYHRIGTNRQKLATTVLLVDQSINKELAREKVDTAKEKEILRELREIEKIANNQLPHFHKVGAPAIPAAQGKTETKPKPGVKEKPIAIVKEKPVAKEKPEIKPKPAAKSKPKAETKSKVKAKAKKK